MLHPAWTLLPGLLLAAGLHPLPPGQQGKLTLTRRHLTGGPAVAVISYDADEEHHYYGHVLPPRRTWVLGVRARHVRRGHDIGQLAGQQPGDMAPPLALDL
jgi:hypothetical protein